MDQTGSPSRRTAIAVAASFALLAMIALGFGYWLGAAPARGAVGAPSSGSAEAGFARAMQVHHNQGVQIAMMVRDRTDDPAIRSLAYDIATTQAQQSGQMYGWLEAWRLPQYSSDPAMAWMEQGMEMQGMGQSAGAAPGSATPIEGSTSGAAGSMPGYATPEQIAALEGAQGVDAERQFLRLMIAHHQGALEMAQAALDLSRDPTVETLAGSIVASQTSELRTMRGLLEDRE